MPDASSQSHSNFSKLPRTRHFIHTYVYTPAVGEASMSTIHLYNLNYIKSVCNRTRNRFVNKKPNSKQQRKGRLGSSEKKIIQIYKTLRVCQ